MKYGMVPTRKHMGLQADFMPVMFLHVGNHSLVKK